MTGGRDAGIEMVHAERDTRMTSTYVRVLILEGLICAALWMFGRFFS